VHEPTENKTDDMIGSFCEELDHVFNQFLKYHMKILRDFNPDVEREDIFKWMDGNESLLEISNDNGIRVVNFTTSKNLIVTTSQHL
jgi:hypothetical protein